jgi:serine/threonine-protein kinase
MRTGGEISGDLVYVPGGPFVHGEGKERCEKMLPDFAIARHPVTFGEYAEFLAWTEAEEGLERAKERMPGTSADGAYMTRSEDGRYRAIDGTDATVRERYEREYGKDFVSSLPVIGVSWHDALAYCAWKTSTTGSEWRLPTQEEREKAARGVDGRRFPWGDLADASLCKCRGARDELAQPEPVASFPSATSVYGMADAAGGVWNWTASLYEPHIKASVLRSGLGGSWNNLVDAARAANRYGFLPGNRHAVLGFRLAKSL